MESSDKSALRFRIRELVRAVPADERRALSETLCELMRQQTAWQHATKILFYSALPDEPDITPLLEETWAEKKIAALPRFDPQTNSYAACIVSSRTELSPGRFGALEPGAGCPVVPLNQLDLVLVPGVAYDFTGRRLGRGKGFYDRLLAGVRGHKCGVAFDAQIIAAVPEEPHDMRVNSILTPTRWHLCPHAA
jgi:5-formyltetrahydrofolate cyclo-ligase